MSVSRGQILDLLEQSISGSGLVGGRRRRRRPSRMPSRRYRGRGTEGEEMMIMGEEHMMPMHEESQMYGDGRYGGMGVIGHGLVGGRRRRRKKPMSAAVKRYLAEYRKMHGKRRKKRGGNVYDDLVNELAFQGSKNPEEEALAVIKGNSELIKMGITPKPKKETLISRIRGLEKKLGMRPSSVSNLQKYSVVALGDIYSSLAANAKAFEYPPKANRNAMFDPVENYYDLSGWAGADEGAIEKHKDAYTNALQALKGRA